MYDEGQHDFFKKEIIIELDENSRTCTECNKTKLLDDFPNDPTMYQGKRHQCRQCTNVHVRVVNFLKTKHRYPDDDYKCPICEKSFEGKVRRKGITWCLDHCHITNQFRGWLCENCNSGIGKLKDSVELLQRAIKYLEGNVGDDKRS